MNSDSPEYHIRPLEGSDEEDILEIAKHTWDGHDYLPFYFRRWLENKDCHTAAIIISNKVAALANLRVIEKGKTGWMEGLRVHLRHRGKGLASVLTRYLVRKAVEIGVQRLRYTTASDNTASLHLAKSIGLSPIHEMGIFWYSESANVSWGQELKSVIPADPSDILTLVASPRLFQKGIIMHDWKAYDASVEAVKYLKDAKFWVAGNENGVMSISIGNERGEGEKNIWCVSIHALSKDHLLSHLSYHFATARDKFDGLFVMYPLKYTEDLKQIPWIMKHHREREELMRMILLEKVLGETS